MVEICFIALTLFLLDLAFCCGCNISISGNVKVFCRARPLFEDEGPSIVEFPDEFTIRVNTGDDSLTNPKKDYEFDRVYGPHVGQGKNQLPIFYSLDSHFYSFSIPLFF